MRSAQKIKPLIVPALKRKKGGRLKGRAALDCPIAGSVEVKDWLDSGADIRRVQKYFADKAVDPATEPEIAIAAAAKVAELGLALVKNGCAVLASTAKSGGKDRNGQSANRSPGVIQQFNFPPLAPQPATAILDTD